MPTLVDELVLRLGFDSTGFKKGRVETGAELKKIREEAAAMAKDMAASGKQAAEAFAVIKNGALSLFAVLLGGKGIESFVKDTTKSLTDLGQAATHIGAAVPQLAAFANMIDRNGGTAAAATSSLIGLTDAMENYRVHADSPLAPFFSNMGIGRDANAMDAYMKFVAFAEQHANDVPLINLMGHGIGLDQGTIDATVRMRTTGRVREEMQRSVELGVASQKQIDAANKFETSVKSFEQAVAGMSRSWLEKILPGLTAWFDQITKDISGPAPTLDDLKKINPDLTRDVTGAVDAVRQYLPAWLGGTPHSGGTLPPDIETEVRRQAGLRRLDPDHMVALYRKEGGGYDNVSPAGAFGPSQLMPGTAARFGVNRNGPWQDNVRGGLEYYQWLLQHFGGNYQAADAAYNAGENNPGVKRFATTGDPSGLPAETRDYVYSINHTPNGVPRRGPVFGPQHRLDPALAPNRLAGPRVSNTTSTSSTAVDIGTMNIHTRATDARGISADMTRALTEAMVDQANRGLQ